MMTPQPIVVGPVVQYGVVLYGRGLSFVYVHKIMKLCSSPNVG